MDSLSPRERVATVLAHKDPDKVPIDLGEGRQTSIYRELYLKALAVLGLGESEIITSPRGVIDQFDERFLKSLDIDFRRVSLRDVPEGRVFEPGGILRDEWDIGWKKAGYFVSPVDHPLKDATIDDLRKEFALELIGKVLEYHLKLYERYLEEVGEFVNIVHTADDLGTQTGPYFSLEMYREMIKPKEKAFLDLIKNKTEAKILYHSDGAISTFIDDLIEIGVDILNPIQPSEAMDPLVLKGSFGDRLSFHGGIDQHEVLPQGTPDEVGEEVKRRIQQGFGSTGHDPYRERSSDRTQSRSPALSGLSPLQLLLWSDGETHI